MKPEKKIGIVSFTDPRTEVGLIQERELFIKNQHTKLVADLKSAGFNVIDPMKTVKHRTGEVWAINNLKAISEISNLLNKENISGLIIGCFAWNEPHQPLELAKKINCPIALATTDNTKWPGITAITSTGATFWEIASNHYIKNHSRFILTDGLSEDLLDWTKAVCALNYLQQGKLILWGGTPALHMAHLNDDIPFLKSFLINEIETEDQYVLVKKSSEIMKNAHQRIEAMISWLENNNCKIIYDKKMLTKQALEKQIALYLAAKDLILKRNTNGERIIGSSIKCQPELSIDFGVTACLLPALLPFSFDGEGKKPILNTVCEGDIKGLLTSLLLYGINPDAPALFGDLKQITDDYFVIANCGGASAYYAANSLDPNKALANSKLEAQCQGESGAAFGFYTPPVKSVATFARLIRIEGQYYLQVGLGKILEFSSKEQKNWGATWPHTKVELRSDKNAFIGALGTNHLSLTIGDHIASLNHISRLLAIPLIRIDITADCKNFIQKL